MSGDDHEKKSNAGDNVGEIAGNELQEEHLKSQGENKNVFKKLSFLFFSMGITWLFLFPAVTISTGELKTRGMFVDENALNPYNIRPTLHEPEMKAALGIGYRGEKGDRPPTLQDLCVEFTEAGLPCHTHVYEQEAAWHTAGAGPRKVVRQNLYTISKPSPGSDGKDALVLAVDWPKSWHQEDLDSFRVALILVQHFQKASFVAKNIIVLVTGNPEDRPGPKGDAFHPGVKTWLKDYFSDFNTLIEEKHHLAKEGGYDLHNLIVEHAGAIRAALVLDLPAGYSQWLGLKVLSAGINGQQPNMDILAVTLHVFGPYSIVIDRCMGELQGGRCDDLIAQTAATLARWTRPVTLPVVAQQYLRRLFGMFSYMAALASGPSHAHAHFLHHSIDAVTLQGIPSHGTIDPQFSKSKVLTNFGIASAMSQLIRSLNNLEEDLHHSYFYYLMPLPTHFVEINEYLNAVFGIMMPLFLQAFVFAYKTRPLMGKYAAGVIASAGAFGYLSFILLRALFISQYELHTFVTEMAGNSLPGWVSEEKLVVLSWLAFLGVAYPLLLWILQSLKHVLLDCSSTVDRDNGWKTLKCFCSFSFVFLHVMLSIVNYSFSLIVCLVAVPIFLFLQPTSWARRRFWLYNALLTVVSPFSLIFWLGCLDPSTSGMEMFLKMIRGYMEAGVLYVPYICMVFCALHLISIHVLYSSEPKKETSYI